MSDKRAMPTSIYETIVDIVHRHGAEPEVAAMRILNAYRTLGYGVVPLTPTRSMTEASIGALGIKKGWRRPYVSETDKHACRVQAAIAAGVAEVQMDMMRDMEKRRTAA
jgi:hypothetical protein